MTPWRASLLGSLAVLAVAAAAMATTAGAAPSPTPTPGPSVTEAPPTCAERFPGEGPAGVDLQLGCVVNELISFVGGAAADPGEPHRLSEYALPIAIGLGACLIAFLAVRQIGRTAGRRLAPAAPSAVWSCPSCRSLNDASHDRCYHCRRPYEAGDFELRTDAEPLAPQSFGRRQDGRRRKDEPG